MLFAAFLSVVLVATSAVEKREQKCYGNLGCFSSLPGIPALPQDPAHVQTTYLLFTRQNRGTAVKFEAASPHSTWSKAVGSSHFSASRHTKFIIHGFMDSGLTDWILKTKDALLNQGDYNVFLVDWKHGAVLPYEQATANVFLVAKQTATFIQNLHSSAHLNYGDVHIIGHSLGAQMAGVIGSNCRGIGRITGLDPAEPDFTVLGNAQHLDSSDAHFVDVIHSDGGPYTGVAGYGWIKPLGHIDFYPNGGMDQPGCSDSPIGSALHNLLHGNINKVTGSVSCSHGRSHVYFLESIQSSCKFLAHKCHSWADYEAGSCHGCSGDCPQMGINADQSKNLRGSYYLSTSQDAPFCGSEYFVEIDVAPLAKDAYGRFFITIQGSHGSSKEVEFSRKDHYYTKSTSKEKHIIAVHHDVGTITGVKVKYQKGSGLAALGTPDSIKITSVSVRKQTDTHQTRYCDNGKTTFESGKTHSLSHKC